MSWLWVAGLALFAILGISAFFVARSPSFWMGLVKEVIALAVPDIIKYITTRNTFDIEQKMHECVRRGGTWDNFRKKCRDK